MQGWGAHCSFCAIQTPHACTCGPHTRAGVGCSDQSTVLVPACGRPVCVCCRGQPGDAPFSWPPRAAPRGGDILHPLGIQTRVKSLRSSYTGLYPQSVKSLRSSYAGLHPQNFCARPGQRPRRTPEDGKEGEREGGLDQGGAALMERDPLGALRALFNIIRKPNQFYY